MLVCVKRYRNIFEEPDQAAIAASDARARADLAAGRYYDHATVARWLKTWGAPQQKPFHEWLNSSG
jgi:predicted transcriptional regulator